MAIARFFFLTSLGTSSYLQKWRIERLWE